MARGLSDLQKWMLVRALENSESDLCKPEVLPAIPSQAGIRGCREEISHPVHLTRNEIRADYYKFTPVCRVYRRTYAVLSDGGRSYLLPRWAAEWEAQEVEENKEGRAWLRRAAKFVKSNHPNYAAVNLAIARAHDRLRKRGLATDQVGFWLTDKGREAAKLLASPARTSAPVQPIEVIGSPISTALTVQPIEMELV